MLRKLEDEPGYYQDELKIWKVKFIRGIGWMGVKKDLTSVFARPTFLEAEEEVNRRNKYEIKEN